MDWPFRMLVFPAMYAPDSIACSTIKTDDVCTVDILFQKYETSETREWALLTAFDAGWRRYVRAETGNTDALCCWRDMCRTAMDARGVVQAGSLLQGVYAGVCAEIGIQRVIARWYVSPVSPEQAGQFATHLDTHRELCQIARDMGASVLHTGDMHRELVDHFIGVVVNVLNLVYYMDRVLDGSKTTHEARTHCPQLAWFYHALRQTVWTRSATIAYYGRCVPRPTWLHHLMYVVCELFKLVLYPWKQVDCTTTAAMHIALPGADDTVTASCRVERGGGSSSVTRRPPGLQLRQ